MVFPPEEEQAVLHLHTSPGMNHDISDLSSSGGVSDMDDGG